MPKRYTDSDIVVRFEVMDRNRPIKPLPTSARVEVMSPKWKELISGFAKVEKSEVVYKLGHKYVTEPGVYTFRFKVSIPYYGEYDHDMPVNVYKPPEKVLVKLK